MKTRMTRLFLSLVTLSVIGFGCGGVSHLSIGLTGQIQSTRVSVHPKHRPVVVHEVTSYDAVVSDGHYVDDVYYSDDGDVIYGEWVRTEYPDGEYVEIWEVDEEYVDCAEGW